MSTDRAAEDLDRELHAHAAASERALAQEQARNAELVRELDLAATWNRQLDARLKDAQVELRVLHRLPIDLPRLFERRSVRLLVRLVHAIRGRGA